MSIYKIVKNVDKNKREIYLKKSYYCFAKVKYFIVHVYSHFIQFVMKGMILIRPIKVHRFNNSINYKAHKQVKTIDYLQHVR